MRVSVLDNPRGGRRTDHASLPVAPAMGHVFLIIEGRVRRVGHFIKKKKQLANRIITKNTCNIMFLRGGISPIFKSYIYLKSDEKMSSFSVCVFIE